MFVFAFVALKSLKYIAQVVDGGNFHSYSGADELSSAPRRANY